MRKILSKQEYRERWEAFLQSCGPSPAGDGFDKWLWAAQHREPFHKQLLAEHTWYENFATGEYIALRESPYVRSFLSADPNSIAGDEFEKLVVTATKEAFSDTEYVNDLRSNAQSILQRRSRETLKRVFADRGIEIKTS